VESRLGEACKWELVRSELVYGLKITDKRQSMFRFLSKLILLRQLWRMFRRR